MDRGGIVDESTSLFAAGGEIFRCCPQGPYPSFSRRVTLLSVALLLHVARRPPYRHSIHLIHSVVHMPKTSRPGATIGRGRIVDADGFPLKQEKTSSVS